MSIHYFSFRSDLSLRVITSLTVFHISSTKLYCFQLMLCFTSPKPSYVLQAVPTCLHLQLSLVWIYMNFKRLFIAVFSKVINATCADTVHANYFFVCLSTTTNLKRQTMLLSNFSDCKVYRFSVGNL